MTSRQPNPSPARKAGIVGGRLPLDARSIGQDLHDLGINRLSRLAFELSGVTNLLDGDALERVMTVIDAIDALVGDVRWFVLAGLDRGKGDGDFEAGIRTLATQSAERMGGTAEVLIDGDLLRLAPQVGHHLRAVVAEAVHNSATHSTGSRLRVLVQVAPHQVVARITDNGRGPPDPPVYGLGLGSMASRARQLGGSFEFVAAPGGGAAVTWCVPVPSMG